MNLFRESGGSGPIGIVGGSGLYEISEISIESEVKVDTPFGEPSDTYVIGRLGDTRVIFLTRHGPGHRVTAPGVNFRANVYGFKSLGVRTLIGISAVGSMREDIHPMDIVIPDQFIDMTKMRESTFFEGNPAVHIEMADPFCKDLAEALFDAASAAGANVALGGTYVCIEGPAFSTRAESKLYRSWGVDVIGMTAATEAKLCREAEICYSSVSLVTDYDVWKEGADDVTFDTILEYVTKNADTAKKIIVEAVRRIPDLGECACRRALATAIASNPGSVPDVTRNRMEVLLGKYLAVSE